MVVNIYYIVTHYASTTSTYIRTKLNVLDIKNFGGLQNEVRHILPAQNSSEYKWLIYSSVAYLLECKLEKYYSFEVNNGIQQKAHISPISSYF